MPVNRMNYECIPSQFIKFTRHKSQWKEGPPNLLDIMIHKWDTMNTKKSTRVGNTSEGAHLYDKAQLGQAMGGKVLFSFVKMTREKK